MNKPIPTLAALTLLPAAFLPALLLAVCALPLRADPQPARSSDDFVDRIGVATHWGYGDTPYGYAYDKVKALLADSGIRHVRDGFGPRLPDLYQSHGIKATVIYGPGTPAPAIVAQVKQNRDLIDMVEGPNEVDVFASSAAYEGKTFPQGPIAFQTDLYGALKGDPETRGVGVIAPSTARSDSNLKLAPLAAEDYVVMHSYAGGAPPETSLEGGYVPNTLNAERLLGAHAVWKPIVVTESGYHTALNGGGGVIAGVQPGVSEAAQAKYLPRHFALYFNAGIARTITYEFCDEFEHEDTNAEAAFGIVRRDLTPKPAYSALKNLIGLLNESHWDAAAQKWQRPAFRPRALDFTLTPLPTLRHTLLQKANGDYYLLIWQEVSSFDTGRKLDVVNPPVPVTLTFRTPVVSAASYLPGQSAAVQQVWHDARTLTLSVPDEVLAVRLTPPHVHSAFPPRPPKLSAETTGTTGTLSWPPNADGYFVSRLGRDVGRTTGTTFTDKNLQPDTGYPYEIRAYDSSGRTSDPASLVAFTRDERPDLTITALTLSPDPAKPGDPVRFGVTIKNVGQGPTPAGITHGVAFTVDGQFVSWSDTFNGPLAPGESKTLTANNGPKGTAFWTATPGPHTVTATVDDLNRITESDETNNVKTQAFTVAP